MDDFKITLDREAFKALASDTRLSILKALDERPMTVSELGRKLELNKATVFEHLEKLVAVALIRKEEDVERKWVYYSLTWKGRRILHPERVTIAILLSTALGALTTGALFLAAYLTPTAPEPPTGGPEAARSLASDMAQAPPPTSASADPVTLYVAVALFLMVAILSTAGFLLWRRANAKQA
ncbi:MAG TPA: winged helix-turn-helix domain-containing protein [Candidatus Thermoplasmatota archaeon]|nr:winged helix-turn-helix domain-containing protein [Candidatus Thermoplasmatota archaeon]